MCYCNQENQESFNIFLFYIAGKRESKRKIYYKVHKTSTKCFHHEWRTSNLVQRPPHLHEILVRPFGLVSHRWKVRTRPRTMGRPGMGAILQQVRKQHRSKHLIDLDFSKFKHFFLRFQIWRPLTALFFYKPSFHWLINLYFLYSYSMRLETGIFAGRPADYAFMLFFR